LANDMGVYLVRTAMYPGIVDFRESEIRVSNDRHVKEAAG